MRSPALTSRGIDFAIFQALALADGDDFAFLRLFFGRVGNVQATLHRFLLFDPFDHNAVVKRTNIHDRNNLPKLNS